MKDEVIRILSSPKSEETVRELSELCNIKDFQSSNLIDEYKKIYDIEVDMLARGIDTSNYAKEKQVIIRGLTSGEYAKSEVIKEAYIKEIERVLSLDSEEACKCLTKLCNLGNEEAINLVSKFKEVERLEEEMIANYNYSSEYTMQKRDIINLLANR